MSPTADDAVKMADVVRYGAAEVRAALRDVDAANIAHAAAHGDNTALGVLADKLDPHPVAELLRKAWRTATGESHEAVEGPRYEQHAVGMMHAAQARPHAIPGYYPVLTTDTGTENPNEGSVGLHYFHLPTGHYWHLELQTSDKDPTDEHGIRNVARSFLVPTTPEEVVDHARQLRGTYLETYGKEMIAATKNAPRPDVHMDHRLRAAGIHPDDAVHVGMTPVAPDPDEGDEPLPGGEIPVHLSRVAAKAARAVKYAEGGIGGQPLVGGPVKLQPRATTGGDWNPQSLFLAGARVSATRQHNDGNGSFDQDTTSGGKLADALDENDRPNAPFFRSLVPGGDANGFTDQNGNRHRMMLNAHHPLRRTIPDYAGTWNFWPAGSGGEVSGVLAKLFHNNGMEHAAFLDAPALREWANHPNVGGSLKSHLTAMAERLEAPEPRLIKEQPHFTIDAQRMARAAKVMKAVRRYSMQGDIEQFHKAINANPQDMTTRGVYADWLDENGGHADPDLPDLLRTHPGPVRLYHSRRGVVGGPNITWDEIRERNNPGTFQPEEGIYGFFENRGPFPLVTEEDEPIGEPVSGPGGHFFVTQERNPDPEHAPWHWSIHQFYDSDGGIDLGMDHATSAENAFAQAREMAENVPSTPSVHPPPLPPPPPPPAPPAGPPKKQPPKPFTLNDAMRPRFSRLSGIVRAAKYAAYRAPAGGAIARGVYTPGGEFMPDMEGAFMNPPAPKKSQPLKLDHKKVEQLRVNWKKRKVKRIVAAPGTEGGGTDQAVQCARAARSVIRYSLARDHRTFQKAINGGDLNAAKVYADLLDENDAGAPGAAEHLRTTTEPAWAETGPDGKVYAGRRWDMQGIRAAMEAAGSHWFDPGTMRFFRSRLHGEPIHGPNGIYFVTSEVPPHSGRMYTVRGFDPGAVALGEEVSEGYTPRRPSISTFELARHPDLRSARIVAHRLAFDQPVDRASTAQMAGDFTGVPDVRPPKPEQMARAAVGVTKYGRIELDHAPFHRQILNDINTERGRPEHNYLSKDATSSLVYADWLEENGMPNAAAFVRETAGQTAGTNTRFRNPTAIMEYGPSRDSAVDKPLTVFAYKGLGEFGQRVGRRKPAPTISVSIHSPHPDKPGSRLAFVLDLPEASANDWLRRLISEGHPAGNADRSPSLRRIVQEHAPRPDGETQPEKPEQMARAVNKL